MIKNIFIIFILLILTSCSFDTKSGIWTEELITSNSEENKNIKELFKKEILNENEFNPDLKLKISKNQNNQNKINGNNHGALQVKSNFKKFSKYNFKKIEYFNQFEPELVFDNTDLIFFDNKGSLIRFDDKSKIKWKINHYNKKEKKLLPILKLTKMNKNLLVTDSLAKMYLLNISNGKLIWMQDHIAPIISQIKIENNKFYALDANNTLTCFSLSDGKKLWEFKSERKLINSQKQTSIILNDNSVIFNNSKGEIISLDKFNGNLNWLVPTMEFGDVFQSYLVKNSDLVLNENNIYFSNNKNLFFSIDTKIGIINWKQNINSSLRPIIINDLIFTISSSGYLYVLEKNSGNIIRVTDIFYNIKTKKRKKIKVSGFILTNDKLYLSTNQGKIIKVNINNGNLDLVYKISRNKISKPYVNNSKLYVIKDNGIIKIN